MTSAKAFSAEELAEMIRDGVGGGGMSAHNANRLLRNVADLQAALEESSRHADTWRKLDGLADSMRELKPRLVDAPNVGEIRKRADAATPGPWKSTDMPVDGSHWTSVDVEMGDLPATEVWGRHPEDAQATAFFIAHARTDVPRLCDALAKRDAELAEVIAALGLREDIDTGRVLVEACRQISDETTAALDELAKANEKLRLALSWEDVPADEWTGAINDAFPTRSGSHDEYAVAMQMVGHRRSKGELVALVNWLLVRRDPKREATWAARFRVQAEQIDELNAVLAAERDERRAFLAKMDEGDFAGVIGQVVECGAELLKWNAERVAKTEECERMRKALDACTVGLTIMGLGADDRSKEAIQRILDQATAAIPPEKEPAR